MARAPLPSPTPEQTPARAGPAVDAAIPGRGDDVSEEAEAVSLGLGTIRFGIVLVCRMWQRGHHEV